MVTDPGAPLGAGDLPAVATPVAFKAPVPIEVQADASGSPLAVRRRHWPQARAVARVQDRWRIDDEWWRARPIARLYHALLLADDTLLVVYHDLVTGAWFEQPEPPSPAP